MATVICLIRSSPIRAPSYVGVYTVNGMGSAHPLPHHSCCHKFIGAFLPLFCRSFSCCLSTVSIFICTTTEDLVLFYLYSFSALRIDYFRALILRAFLCVFYHLCPPISCFCHFTGTPPFSMSVMVLATTPLICLLESL